MTRIFRAGTIVVLALVIAIGVLGGAAVRAQRGPETVPARTLYQQGLFEEQANGNLAAATTLYERAFAAAGTDRALAAEVLIHLADAQRRLGRATARSLYERVLKDYADQPDAVRRAMAWLAPREESAESSRKVWALPPLAQLAGPISYDGRSILYVDWSDAGRADLFVHVTGVNADRRLTQTGNVVGKPWMRSADRAVVSRDGRRIVYSWTDDAAKRRELRIIESAGTDSPPRPLISLDESSWIEPHDWSTDGQWIAVMWREGNGPRHIGLVSVKDGSRRSLELVDRPCACDLNLSLSPDGRYLAFDLPGVDTRARDIFIVTTDTARKSPAVVYSSHDALIGWAADGSALLFESDRSHLGTNGLWLVPFAEGQTGVAKQLQGDIGSLQPLGVTASGALYLCGCGSSTPTKGSDVKIATFDFSSGKFVAPPLDAVQQYVGYNSSPEWSADGASFAYLSNRPNQDPILAIQDTASGDVRELRPKLQTMFGPRWTPDGKSILVFGKDFEDRFGWRRIDTTTGRTAPIVMYNGLADWIGPMAPESFWVADGRTFTFRRRVNGVSISLVEVDIASGDERVLVELPRTSTLYAQRSPDRRLLYFRRPIEGTTDFAIVARDVTAGTERELFRRANLGGFNLSPDGRWLGIAVRHTADQPSLLLTLPAQGGEARELFRAKGAEEIGAREGVNAQLSIGPGTWAPDSRSMIVRKDTSDRPEFWWVPMDGGAPRKLIEFDGFNPAVLRVHPDGHRILFSANTMTSAPPAPIEIWMFENAVRK